MSLALVQRTDTTLSPSERLELLCDRDSLKVIRSDVVLMAMGPADERGSRVEVIR